MHTLSTLEGNRIPPPLLSRKPILGGRRRGGSGTTWVRTMRSVEVWSQASYRCSEGGLLGV